MSHAQNSYDTIHIALAVYDPSGTYSQHAGVVMTSIFTHTQSKVTIHILHDNTLTHDNRQKFIRTAAKYSQGLELHDVTEYRERIDRRLADSFSDSFTVGTLFRLALQDIIPLDKIIYLDCDILVNLDIQELWNIDLEGNYFAGVQDEIVCTQGTFSYEGIRCRLNGCKASDYINAGVLVINLDATRNTGDFFTTAAQWLKSHIYSSPYADQEAYNALFAGKIKLLDHKFNRQVWDNDSDLSASIIHTNKRKSMESLPGNVR